MMVIDKTGLEIVPIRAIMLWSADFFIGGFMLFGGAVPYVSQYLEIVERKNAQGFSLHVCLALYVANILRILFWFGKHFSTVLLGQSIIIIIVMTLMLEISVRMNRKTMSKRASIWRLQIISHFWAWSDLSSYFIALTVFTVIFSALTAALIQSELYIDILGTAALLTEACLGIPQFIRNCKRRSTKGMSIQMVLLWLVGDCAKLIYFLVFNQPAQFWVCAILQITVDVLILLQVRIYGKGPPNAAALPVQ